MQPSKKLLMFIGTILGNLLVMIVYNFFPDLPAEVVQYAIAGISATGLGGVVGQGVADGMSRGLTSSKGKEIAALREKEIAVAELELLNERDKVALASDVAATGGSPSPP